MRRNENYLLRAVADRIVVIPFGSAAAEFNGMVTLNETGRFLWEQLSREQTKESLTAAVQSAYNGDIEQISSDINAFLNKLVQIGALYVQPGELD